MTKIYKTFDEFVTINKSVLQILGSEEKNHIYKAIWDAREGEITELRTHLKECESRLFKLEGQEAEWIRYIEQVEAENSHKTDILTQLSTHESQNREKLSLLESLKQRFEEMSKEKELLLKEITHLKTRVDAETLAKQISEKKSEQLQSHMNTLKHDYDDLYIDHSKIAKERMMLRTELSKLVDELQGLYFEKSNHQEGMDDLKALVRELSNELQKSHEKKNSYREKLTTLATYSEQMTNENKTLHAKIQELEGHLNTQNQREQALQNKYVQLEERAALLNIENRNNTLTLTRLEADLATLKEGEDRAKTTEQQAKEQMIRFDVELDKMSRYVTQIKTEHESLKEERDELYSLKIKLEEGLQFVVSDNQQVRALLEERVLDLETTKKELDLAIVQNQELNLEVEKLQAKMKEDQISFELQKNQVTDLKQGVEDLVTVHQRVKQEKRDLLNKLSLYDERFNSMAKEISYYKGLHERTIEDMNSLKTIVDQTHRNFKSQSSNSRQLEQRQ